MTSSLASTKGVLSWNIFENQLLHYSHCSLQQYKTKYRLDLVSLWLDGMPLNWISSSFSNLVLTSSMDISVFTPVEIHMLKRSPNPHIIPLSRLVLLSMKELVMQVLGLVHARARRPPAALKIIWTRPFALLLIINLHHPRWTLSARAFSSSSHRPLHRQM